MQFIAEYENGKTSRAIFEDAGFDVNIIGIKRIDSASLRWRKAYNDKGILGLEDTRTLNSGRTLNTSGLACRGVGGNAFTQGW